MAVKEYPGSVLPSLTLHWLDLNTTETYYDPKRKGQPYTESGLQAASKSKARSEDLDPALEDQLMEGIHGISKELLEENRDRCNYKNYILLEEADSYFFDLPLTEDNPVLIDRQQVRVKEGRRAVALFNLHTEGNVAGYRNGTLTIDLPEDAFLHLILVHRLNGQSVNNLSLDVRMGDGAGLYLTHLELGAGVSNFNFGCDMPGFESLLDVSNAFITEGKGKLDLYYDVKQIAPYTQAQIRSNGALLDQARKSFRGTIDFQKGAYGAVGDESENTILMSDQCRSFAVPILLCHEENVVGNHAASAGQLDEEMLFYLESRGLPRKDAEGMIIESRMVPTIDRIPDPTLRQQLQEEIHERIVGR
jgi:Fe-S cluster assembly protein SufD